MTTQQPGSGQGAGQDVWRILHIGKFYPPDRGGMETYLADLLQQQRASGIDAAALVHGRPRADDPPWLRRLPVHLRLVYTPVSLGFPLALRNSLKTFRPDVLHLHMPNVAVFWLLLSRQARRIPWVVHWHSDVTFSSGQTALALAYRLYEPFERAVLAQACFIVATSPPYLSASKTLQAWRSKCVAIPLGLQNLYGDTQLPATTALSPDGVTMQHADDPAEAAAARWLPGRLRIVSVGRLTYYKGFDTLIRAVAGMPQAELKIVGDGALRTALQGLIEELQEAGQPGHIVLLGEVSEALKHALLRSSDVFALASRERTEAFGLALVEAMQFARPCVVSDLAGSGMPWLIRQAKAGLCVPMDDVAAWRVALQQLADVPGLRQRLGMAGSKAARQLFSIQSSSGQLQALYATLVRENQPTQRQGLIAVPLAPGLTAAQLDALLARYLQLNAGELLLLEQGGSAAAGRALDCRRSTVGFAVLQVPWRGDSAANLQTAIRWGLRRGHSSVLLVPQQISAVSAGQWPALQAGIQDLLSADGPGADNKAAIIYAVPARTGSRAGEWASRWFFQLTGAPACPDLRTCLQLYQHEAMQEIHSLRWSLADMPEVGLSWLAAKAGMSTRVQVSEPLALLHWQRPWRRSWRALFFMVSATLVYLSKGRRLLRRREVGRADRPAP